MSLLLNARVKWSFLPGIQPFHHFKPLRCVSTIENVPNKGKEEPKPLVKSTYQVSDVEANWYELWESRNYFKPSKSEADSFTVLLPPPNITGTLHLGHALTCTLQDIILRWKRMKGESVLWVPGIDHAGIATQVAVEKYLTQSSGLSRHDLGREKFVKAIWEWKDEKTPKIVQQLRKLGASLDWSRLIFTLDPSHSDLVNKSFIQLYNDGLIYRKKSLINWSCALKSSISDIEVDVVTINKRTEIVVPGYDKPVTFGCLYKCAYKVCDEDDEIVVATSRPETMLGDVAIAIHPDDPELSRFKDKYVWHPFRNEKIPIIVDDFVRRDIGTGAVKITPSHSLVDFEIGRKHNLQSIPVINEDGCINNIGTNEKFHGLKRYHARRAIIEELKNLGLFRGSSSHSGSLPVCSRSGDVVELLLKDQWFLKSDALMDKAVEVVQNGDLQLIPESYKSVWYNWLSKKPIRDWNLSRQLWWGHQVPMYECRYKEKTIWKPGLSLEEATSAAAAELGAPPGDITVVQDPDVLDTWFSSGLLSLNSVIDQKRSPPISLMVTGHDILFFWLVRMVILSTQLKGQLPFKEAFLHGLVYDANGKKMSKSVGNVIHPDDIMNGLSKSEMEARLRNDLEEGRITKKNYMKAVEAQNTLFPAGIPECGADALRFTLASASNLGAVTSFDINKCIANKHFCNKIYQGFNYFTRMADMYQERRKEFDVEDVKSLKEKLNYFDLWILSRLASVVERVDGKLTSYRFDMASEEIKDFIVDDFCNFYLNTTKPIVENCSSDQFKTTMSVFFHCFENFLRLLSPFMPFLTEYLYHEMPSFNGYEKYESVTVAKYPDPADCSEFRDRNLEATFEKLSEFLTIVRRVKIYCKLNNQPPNVLIQCPDNLAEVLFSEVHYVFPRLAKMGSLTRTDNLNYKNVIRQDVDRSFVVLIEHNYDRATLSSLLHPTISKGPELRRSLRNLQETVNGPKWLEMSVSKKFTVTKDIKNLNLDLKRINELQLSLNLCER